MKIYAGQNDSVLAYLDQQTEFVHAPNTYLLWADEGGRLLGAMGFGGRMGRVWGSVSIALQDARAALPLIRAAARWLFGEMRAVAAYISIPSVRAEWIDALVGTIGFRSVDLARDALGPDCHLLMLKLTPETCRPWQAELRKKMRKAA